MSVFVKTNDMNPVVELVTVEGVKMNISDVYDRIEAIVDKELEKFDNTSFEVYDDELTSKGWIVIGNGVEDELQVLKTVKDTIDKIKGVEIVIDKMPSIQLDIYNYEFEIDIKGVITPQKTFKGDNMKWTIVEDEKIEPMTLEEFEKLGTICLDEKEDIEYEFNDLKGVFFAIIDLGFDLTKTNVFKKAQKDWFKSDVKDEDIFLDVFFEMLFDEDICFEEPKNIVIEEVIEDVSFDYDYGSISSTHHCSVVLGYNVKVEDVE